MSEGISDGYSRKIGDAVRKGGSTFVKDGEEEKRWSTRAKEECALFF